MDNSSKSIALNILNNNNNNNNNDVIDDNATDNNNADSEVVPLTSAPSDSSSSPSSDDQCCTCIDGFLYRLINRYPCLSFLHYSLSSNSSNKPGRPIRLSIILFIFACISGFCLWLLSGDKCNMKSNLLPMLSAVTSTLKHNKIEYFLDYGTLLGAVRDQKIVPWEFDLDFGLMEEDCDRLDKLKDEFKRLGYEAFGRNEAIRYKENKIMGYDPYIHMPCMRIYTQDAVYYTDIYWYQKITPARYKRIRLNMERSAQGLPLLTGTEPGGDPLSTSPPKRSGPSFDIDLESQIIPPWNYYSNNNNNENLICNYEGFTNELPGGCALESDMFPLATIPLEGTEQPIPNKADNRLRGQYGADWRTPKPKGYKVLVCSWLPSSTFFAIFTSMTFTISCLILFLIYGCPIWRNLKKKFSSTIKSYQSRVKSSQSG